MTDDLILQDAFERVMQPVRALGWQVSFAYQPGASSWIYARHPLFPPQAYTKMVFYSQPVEAVYERWFTSCAALLRQLVLALPQQPAGHAEGP